MTFVNSAHGEERLMYKIIDKLQMSQYFLATTYNKIDQTESAPDIIGKSVVHKGGDNDDNNNFCMIIMDKSLVIGENGKEVLLISSASSSSAMPVTRAFIELVPISKYTLRKCKGCGKRFNNRCLLGLILFYFCMLGQRFSFWIYMFILDTCVITVT